MRTSEFVRSLTHREHRAMSEHLPPLRAALLEQGLLDRAKTATAVGKTLLARFRILQALNPFRDEGGWVVYVAPTRALSAQITRRLRTDFAPAGLRAGQLAASVEVDAFEEALLGDGDGPFDILVATPEKLSPMTAHAAAGSSTSRRWPRPGRPCRCTERIAWGA